MSKYHSSDGLHKWQNLIKSDFDNSPGGGQWSVASNRTILNYGIVYVYDISVICVYYRLRSTQPALNFPFFCICRVVWRTRTEHKLLSDVLILGQSSFVQIPLFVLPDFGSFGRTSLRVFLSKYATINIEVPWNASLCVAKKIVKLFKYPSTQPLENAALAVQKIHWAKSSINFNWFCCFIRDH